MKTFFTLIITVFVCLLLSQEVFSQCNYTSGANGISTGLSSPITIDGNMSDWTTYLSDPDNSSYDNTLGFDLDGSISDMGRDLSRFTFTEDANNLYIYVERAGSTNNSVDMAFYGDINNNGLMEAKEPVIHLSWSGSNGNVSIDIYNYNVSLLGGLLNNITANLDGSMLFGSLSHRGSAGSASGKGSYDGVSVEAKIPFSVITQLNGSGTVINQLGAGQDFKFHVSTINGSLSSVPGLNSINDNFGGCLKAPAIILPVKLMSFSAMLINNTNKVDLNWVTAAEINASHFVIERSTDGNTFSDAGMVFAFGNTREQKNYQYSDNISSLNTAIIYYRLRQVDIDGKFEYSTTRIIRIGKQTENNITILTYPNPVTTELRVTVPNNWQGKKITYTLVNANGQVAKKSENNNGGQTETVNVSTLAPGLYIMKATCGNETAQQKIVKQ